MTDYERNADVSKTLTEQWKAGELPSGWYWVEGSRAEGIYAYTAEYLNNMYRPRNSERIIEKVPSYEIVNSLIKENQQLKELLRECLPIVSAEIMTWQIRGGEESHKRGRELLTHINAVIGAIGD